MITIDTILSPKIFLIDESYVIQAHVQKSDPRIAYPLSIVPRVSVLRWIFSVGSSDPRETPTT